MTGQILAASIVLAIVLLQYLSKRSFGLPIIGLIIGSIIAGLWAEPLAQLLIQAVGTSEINLVQVITKLVLIIIPATSLIWVGKAVKSKPLRIVGSLLFAGLLALLIFDSVHSLVEINSSLVVVYDQIRPYTATIVGIAAVLAVIDVIVHAPAGRQRRAR